MLVVFGERQAEVDVVAKKQRTGREIIVGERGAGPKIVVGGSRADVEVVSRER